MPTIMIISINSIIYNKINMIRLLINIDLSFCNLQIHECIIEILINESIIYTCKSDIGM